MVGVSTLTWPASGDGTNSSTALVAKAQGERVMGDDGMNQGQETAQGQGLAPGPEPMLASVLLQALRALSCLVGDGFDLKLQSSRSHSVTHSQSMTHSPSTFALSGGFVGDRAQGGSSHDESFFSLSAMLSKTASLYPQHEEMQLVLLPLLLIVLTNSLPCKIHCLDLGILPIHVSQLLESGRFRSALHTQAQTCLAQLAMAPSEQAVMPLTTHPLVETDALAACLRVMALAELYEQRRPLGETIGTQLSYQCTLAMHPNNTQ